MNEKGFSVVENLVAIGILAVALTASTPFITIAMHSNGSARTHNALISDIHGTIEGLRLASYASVLAKFSTTPYSSIQNGATVTESATSTRGRSTMTITYTAIKSSSAAQPEAVRVTIDATHRSGKLGNSDYVFETIISGVK